METSVRGTKLGTSTGFVVVGSHGPRLVTNLHVLTGRHLFTGKPLNKMAGIPDAISIQHTDGKWSSGFVATDPDIDWSGLPVFLIDCRSRRGQSGSPVVLRVGEPRLMGANTTRLIGLYSGRIRKESDLGMVWKTEAILELSESTHRGKSWEPAPA